MSNPPSELRIRQAVRALIITPETEVLLVRFEFPTGTRWALPGGGLDPGEDHVAALRRELVEEVGLHHADIGPHIWTREHQIPFINGQWDGQRENIHLVKVPSTFAPQPTLDWPTLNAEYVFEVRWWEVAEIAQASETTFAPAKLLQHIQNIVEQGVPTHPIDVEI